LAAKQGLQALAVELEVAREQEAWGSTRELRSAQVGAAASTSPRAVRHADKSPSWVYEALTDWGFEVEVPAIARAPCVSRVLLRRLVTWSFPIDRLGLPSAPAAERAHCEQARQA